VGPHAAGGSGTPGAQLTLHNKQALEGLGVVLLKHGQELQDGESFRSAPRPLRPRGATGWDPQPKNPRVTVTPTGWGGQAGGAGRGAPHLPVGVHGWLPEVLQAQALAVIDHQHHLDLPAQLGREDGGAQAVRGPAGRVGLQQGGPPWPEPPPQEPV